MQIRGFCTVKKARNINLLYKPSAKPIPGIPTQVIRRIPHLQETQLQGPAHTLGVHPLSSLLQESIIWLKMLLFFEELNHRLWHKNEPFSGYRIKTQIYQVNKGHRTVFGNICPFFERPELWFQASGTFI